jgi:hypothetical protein
VPPPKREVHFKGAVWRSCRQILSENDVIVARKDIATVSIRALAKRYGVKYQTMYNALKGLTFRHLNYAHPPQW